MNSNKYKVFFMNGESIVVPPEIADILINVTDGNGFQFFRGQSENLWINLNNVTHIISVTETPSAVITPPTPQSLKDKEEAARQDSVSSVGKVIEKNTPQNE